MANVTFIGLGLMGLGIAERTASKAASLVARGAVLCSSPSEAARGAEVIVSMVADDAASREVWLGTNGVFAVALAAGTLAIECSTLSHDWVLELASEAQVVRSFISIVR